MLLLHGILVSSWAWRYNLEPLSQHFRVIALCQKGFGWSGKQDRDYTIGALSSFVRDFLDHMKIDRAHLVGNSLGGSVALWLTLDEPDRIGRLVLIDPAAVPLGYVDRFLGLQGPWFAPLYRAVGRPAVFRLLLRTLAYRNIPVDASYMQWFMAPLRMKGALSAAAHVSRTLNRGLVEMFPRLPTIQHPVQLVWGQHDRIVPLKAGLILNRVLPTSRLEVFAHCGHCAMEEDPARFNRLVVDFLGAGE